MRLIYSYWQSMTISTVFWCILNESFAPIRLVEGILVAVITTLCIHYIFKDQLDKGISYRLSPFKLLRLVFVLFWNIYASAIKTIKIILFHSPTPTIIKIHTKSTNAWHNCLIANAITLTPGTITINLDEQELTVLQLYKTADTTGENANTVLGPFENALLERSLK